MLKKSMRLQLDTASQDTSSSSAVAAFCKDHQLQKLFDPPHRQKFELEYFYSSPLHGSYPPFAELTRILENFNAETLRNEQQRQSPPLTLFKNAFMKFIYRELLAIARMDRAEIVRNDAAGKLKRWFLELSEKHSFLEGVTIKKRRATDENVEEAIRKKYISNALSEINDYLRKKLSYDAALPKEPLPNEHRKLVNESDVNLPLIDLQLYRREQAELSRYRERAIESKYFREIKQNTAEIKSHSLSKMRSQELKLSLKPSGSTKKLQSLNTTNSLHNSICLNIDSSGKSSQSLAGRLDTSRRSVWRKKPADIQSMIEERRSKHRITLVDINGINLIRTKAE